MRVERLDHMTRGWFVGDFDPAVVRTSAFEAAIQRFKAGAHHPAHYQREATEITVIVEGRGLLGGRTVVAGDIVMIEPGEVADFVAETDVLTFVLKFPSIVGDKVEVK